jgi:ABC-type sugar transport system ATPase subunit
MALLQVKNINKKLQDTTLLKNICFEQQHLQKLAIAGESGAGKTSLLKIIAGLMQADEGVVLFNDEIVFGPHDKLMPGHPKIAYLSQHYELHNNYTVQELIWFDNKLTTAAATALFKICRIHHLLQRKTNQLSGGEKQRIALCKLLINKPVLLLLDEPFSNLDPVSTATLKNVLDDVATQLQITCLLTSHEPHDTLAWANEIIVLHKGVIVQKAAPPIIYHQPANEYVAGLFGKFNLLNTTTAALFNINVHQKKLLLRPEEIEMLTTYTNHAVAGVIQAISFYGSYYEATVAVNDLQFITRFNSNKLFTQNQPVFLVIKKNSFWFLEA